MTEFKIELQPYGAETRVWMNGEEISGQLEGISVHAHVKEATRIVLQYVAGAVDIEGEPGEVITRDTTEEEE